MTAKVKNYSADTRKGVQHAVFDILMKADRGLYEWTPENVHYGYQHPYSADGRRPTNLMSHQSAPVLLSQSWQPQLAQPQQAVPTTSIYAPTFSGVSHSADISPTGTVPSLSLIHI